MAWDVARSLCDIRAFLTYHGSDVITLALCREGPIKAYRCDSTVRVSYRSHRGGGISNRSNCNCTVENDRPTLRFTSERQRITNVANSVEFIRQTGFVTGAMKCSPLRSSSSRRVVCKVFCRSRGNIAALSFQSLSPVPRSFFPRRRRQPAAAGTGNYCDRKTRRFSR